MKQCRGRLLIEETPIMWTQLGDLTRDISCWKKAWELSGNRFAKAKNRLGTYHFHHKNLEEAAIHFEQSLQIKPLEPDIWFMLGISKMHNEKFDDTLNAFACFVTLDEEKGDAWANIGAIHMRRDNFAQAYQPMKESVKIFRDSHKKWENLLFVCIELQKWDETFHIFNTLIDLKHKSKKDLDPRVVGFVVNAVLEEKKHNQDENNVIVDINVKKAGELLGRITGSTESNPDIWQIYHFYNKSLGRMDQAMDCRMKQCRVLTKAVGWEKGLEQCELIGKVLIQLMEENLETPTKSNLYNCQMYVKPNIKKIGNLFSDSEIYKTIQTKFESMEIKLNEM